MLSASLNKTFLSLYYCYFILIIIVIIVVVVVVVAVVIIIIVVVIVIFIAMICHNRTKACITLNDFLLQTCLRNAT